MKGRCEGWGSVKGRSQVSTCSGGMGQVSGVTCWEVAERWLGAGGLWRQVTA